MTIVISQDQGGKLTLKVLNQSLTGQVREGNGKGVGFLYVNMVDAFTQREKMDLRIKETTDDGELKLWTRDPADKGGQWGQEWSATRSSTPSSADAAVKQVKQMFNQLKVMYTFATVAGAKKWFPAKYTLDEAAREMLHDAFEDEKVSVCRWYDRIAPAGSLLGIPNPFTKSLSKDDVKALLRKEMQSSLEKAEYIRMLRLCREVLNATLDKRVKDHAHAFFKRTRLRSVACKEEALARERKEKDSELQAEWRKALSTAMQRLAPEGAKKVTIQKIVQRTVSNLQIDYSVVVMGSPKLFCTVHGFTVEKDHFEHVISQEIDFKPNPTKLGGFELKSEEPMQVKCLGALGQDRVFSVESCDDGARLKFFSHSRRTQQSREMLHVKRRIHTVAFNENLRMLALYSAESKSVAVFTWDEQFTRHSEYCAPINLETYQENAALFEMHFLFEPKQLCFVFESNAVKIYELIAKSMRPRGFAISQPVKTCVDSTGAALLALRQESTAEKPPCWVINHPQIAIASTRGCIGIKAPCSKGAENAVVAGEDLMRLRVTRLGSGLKGREGRVPFCSRTNIAACETAGRSWQPLCDGRRPCSIGCFVTHLHG